MGHALQFEKRSQIFHSKQKAINVTTKNFAEHTESILKVKEWINNLNLKSNLRDYIDEENGDGEIDSPVSEIAVLDDANSANKLSVETAEKLETPKQHTYILLSKFQLLLVRTKKRTR
ncbi:hypothetical protein TNCV_2308761 [Trichonephila clavipes]|nr:hypothetical protein TNCV_2308761 [Trichonephila clavipes]